MGEALSQKVQQLYASLSGSEGKRWARPEEPILHNLPDEKAEPHVFFYNTNYRTSRKYINFEKIKVWHGARRQTGSRSGLLLARATLLSCSRRF